MNETGTMQLPPQASTFAPQVDQLYYFIFWGCLIFFLLIVGVSAWFIFKYRRRPGDTYRPSPTHNNFLEITWSVVPLVLLMVVFVWGFNGFMTAYTMPAGAKDYYVTGAQWQWRVTHPHGVTEFNEMHVPVDTKIRVILNSVDVIHSFFVPAFRVKMDAYPNQYTTLSSKLPKQEAITCFALSIAVKSTLLWWGKSSCILKRTMMPGFNRPLVCVRVRPRLNSEHACMRHAPASPVIPLTAPG